MLIQGAIIAEGEAAVKNSKQTKRKRTGNCE